LVLDWAASVAWADLQAKPIEGVDANPRDPSRRHRSRTGRRLPARCHDPLRLLSSDARQGDFGRQEYSTGIEVAGSSPNPQGARVRETR
jgi:hypothetical protein